MAKHLTLDSSRVRFNWGYHDGASDVEHDRVTRKRSMMASHFDKIYAQGWEYGVEDAREGVYTGNSDEAWKSRASLRQAPWMPHRKARR